MFALLFEFTTAFFLRALLPFLATRRIAVKVGKEMILIEWN